MKNLYPMLSCIFLLILLFFLLFSFCFCAYFFAYICMLFGRSVTQKREINCYISFFLFFLCCFSSSISFSFEFSYILSSLPFALPWFLFLGHSNVMKRYGFLLICLQGYLFPVRFHSRYLITMCKCMHVHTQIKSWSTYT